MSNHRVNRGIELLASDHPGLYDGWRTQVFTEAAVASAKRGEWVELAEMDAEA
jgi:hypothetical protein